MLSLFIFKDIPPIRLAGAENSNKGRLEVYFKDQWGTVCGEGFDKNGASVACRQLGFKDTEGFEVAGEQKVEPSSQIWMSKVSCKGIETRLEDCSHAGWGMVDSCTHSKDVVLICYRP